VGGEGFEPSKPK